jgi:hypothetical protein
MKGIEIKFMRMKGLSCVSLVIRYDSACMISYVKMKRIYKVSGTATILMTETVIVSETETF